MDSQIRKISIGSNYPDGAMHYQVGGTIRLKREAYTITSIFYVDDIVTPRYDIYIHNEDGTVLWKSILVTMPIVVETNIDFE